MAAASQDIPSVRPVLPLAVAFLAVFGLLSFLLRGEAINVGVTYLVPLNLAMELVFLVLALGRARETPEEGTGWRWLSLGSSLGIAQTLLFLADTRWPGAIPRKELVWFALAALAQGAAVLGILSWPWRVRSSSRILHHLLGSILFCGSLLLIMGSLVNWVPLLGRTHLLDALLLTNSVRVCLFGGIASYLLADRPERWRGPVGWFLMNAVAGGAVSSILFAFWVRGLDWLMGPMCVGLLVAAATRILAAYSRRPVEPPDAGPGLLSPLWEGLPYLAFLAASCTFVVHGLVNPGQARFEAVALLLLLLPLLARQFLLFREVRNANRDLEARVAERTRDLEAAHAGALRMEEERFQLQGQLAQIQKMESIGSLAGGVAHDMNNVLGAILALASSREETEAEDGPAQRAFRTIAQAATRGGEMVNRLLRFARQGTGEQLPVDVNGLLREHVRLLEHTTLAKVRLDLDLAEDLHPVAGDGSALSHAFMNLCVNAVDAMAEDGVLTLRTRNLDAAWIEVRVEDNGCGMSPETQARALDPFFTTKPTGKGTGLGLPLVFSTVRAHRGLLDLDSAPGRGTVVRMRFPACPPEPSGPGEKPHSWAASGVLKVLLVDDDPLVREAAGIMLTVLGHALTTVTRGEEALLRLQEGYYPDVVILDLNMPGLGGARTLVGLEALCPTVPVLLATGRADQTALDLVAAHPQVSLLAKPYGLGDLRERLSRI